jgi:hypothetical protein
MAREANPPHLTRGDAWLRRMGCPLLTAPPSCELEIAQTELSFVCGSNTTLALVVLNVCVILNRKRPMVLRDFEIGLPELNPYQTFRLDVPTETTAAGYSLLGNRFSTEEVVNHRLKDRPLSWQKPVEGLLIGMMTGNLPQELRMRHQIALNLHVWEHTGEEYSASFQASCTWSEIKAVAHQRRGLFERAESDSSGTVRRSPTPLDLDDSPMSPEATPREIGSVISAWAGNGGKVAGHSRQTRIPLLL